MNFLKTKHPVKDALLIVLISALGFLAVLGIVDGFAYVVLGMRAPGYGAEPFFEYHPLAGQIQKPLAKGYWHRYRDGSKFWVEINRFGFSDRERTIAKNKPRIALAGDSTAQFWEVLPEQRGHVLLEQKLGGAWEVLNFGGRGYGIDQTLMLYTDRMDQFSPDIVVLNICINDVWDHAKVDNKPYFRLNSAMPGGIELAGVPVPRKSPPDAPGGLRLYLWNHSFSLRRLGLVRHPELKARYPLEEHFELRPFKKSYNEQDARLELLTHRIIARFAAELKEDGVRLMLVEMPYKPVLTDRGRERIRREYGDQFDFKKWSRSLAGFSHEEGIALVSLPSLIQERQLNAEAFFHPEDQLHLNARGVQLYVEAVTDKLDSLGWLRMQTPSR
ncbi:MAG: SGNH/GDSL hydrolase family protein [Candidatus Omnitrophica bacterium]|nr:SGNH/GDSL hydrolase family protein [Candidatus Omnitrophota bacterium]